MKHLLLLSISLFLALGCGPKDKYDIAAEKSKRDQTFVSADMIDPKDIKLPEGANIEEVTIKKGDKLPDGKIATEDTKLKQFTMTKGADMKFTLEPTKK